MANSETIPSPLDGFLREYLGTARLALVGTTGALRARIASVPAGRLLAGQLLMAFVLGVQTFDPRKALGYPVLLGSLTLIWALLFAFVAELGRDRMPSLYAAFLGTSYILMPAVVPLAGPWFLQALLLGWPFVLARVLAAELDRPPGRILRDLVLPPLILWLTLQAILWIVGRAFSPMEISA